jgi:RNA polymerase sigma factor (TIGR02999 family)
MEHSRHEEVTRLLGAVQHGDGAALDALFPLVYDELRVVARRQRRRWKAGHSLNTTALVHEAYLKFVGQDRATWESRAHFLGSAAKVMRHILLDHARRQRSQKRGGDAPRLSLDEIGEQLTGGLVLSDENADLLLALEAALENLERVSARQSRIVECRFFGGMTIEETAVALGISTASVSRGWAMAQVRLFQDLLRERQS